ncbi:MAG: hypothetical protein GY839_13035 [candidate division Zixibacteria bacterium]|nr:hypothetical protein [candidate division Zixibacteria bacterium]
MLKNNKIDIALILILLTVSIVHIPVILNDFHTDDYMVLEILDDGFDRSAFLSMENPVNFRPLTNIVIFLRYVIFDKNQSLWYLLNICLHLLVVGLLYRFARSIADKVTAIAASLFFGLYFQHFEAILWLYGIVRLLAAGFVLMALINHYKYKVSFNKISLYKSYLFFGLALFCVEDAIVLSLFFSLDAFISGRQTKKKLISYGIGFFAIAALYLIIRIIALDSINPTTECFYIGAHIIKNIYAYIGWLLVPQLDHPYIIPFVGKYLPSLINYIWLVNLSVFLAALAIAWVVIKKGSNKEKLFLVFIAVMLGIAAALDSKVSSKLVYIPSIGLAIIAGSLFIRLLKWLEPKKTKYLIAIAIVYLFCHSAAINFTIIKYRHTQEQTNYLIDKLEQLDIDWDRYDYLLFDNIPGRIRIGFPLGYRFGFTKRLIDISEEVEKKLDIEIEKSKLENAGISYIFIDFSSGDPVIEKKFGGVPHPTGE